LIGPHSTAPPGHWHEIAIEVGEKKGLGLQEMIELLYAQGNAVFDAVIITWDVKRYYDSARPVTVLQCLYEGVQVKSWKGPYQGVGIIDGGTWQPYQDVLFVTPPFAEYVSGHSTFSAASATVLKHFFGSDEFNGRYVIKKGESLFEPKIEKGQDGYIEGVTDVPNSGPETVGYVPAEDVVLQWDTFTAAAEEAGISRLYGGIHIEVGNTHGLELGREVGKQVWEKVSTVTGRNTGTEFVTPVAPSGAASVFSSSLILTVACFVFAIFI